MMGKRLIFLLLIFLCLRVVWNQYTPANGRNSTEGTGDHTDRPVDGHRGYTDTSDYGRKGHTDTPDEPKKLLHLLAMYSDFFGTHHLGDHLEFCTELVNNRSDILSDHQLHLHLVFSPGVTHTFTLV